MGGYKGGHEDTSKKDCTTAKKEKKKIVGKSTGGYESMQIKKWGWHRLSHSVLMRQVKGRKNDAL